MQTNTLVEVLNLCFGFESRTSAILRLKFCVREAFLSGAQNRNIPDFCRESRNIPNFGPEN